MSFERIGIIGLGLLGSAIAERLVREADSERTAAQHSSTNPELLGWDTDPDCLRRGKKLGLRVAKSGCEVFENCDVIWLALPDSNIVQRVLMEEFSSTLVGKVVIDATTGSPSDSELAEAMLSQKGSHYIACTIVGSSEQVRHGEAIALVGGKEGIVKQVGSLFARVVTQGIHLGEVAQAARMKLVANLVLGLNRAALAEGLSFAAAYGLDLPMTLSVLRAGGTYSRVMDSKGEKMILGEFAPQAKLSQHLKDVRLILADGETNQALLPMSTVHEALLARLVSEGMGDLDNSAIMEAFRSRGANEESRDAD